MLSLKVSLFVLQDLTNKPKHVYNMKELPLTSKNKVQTLKINYIKRKFLNSCQQQHKCKEIIYII